MNNRRAISETGTKRHLEIILFYYEGGKKTCGFVQFLNEQASSGSSLPYILASVASTPMQPCISLAWRPFLHPNVRSGECV